MKVKLNLKIKKEEEEEDDDSPLSGFHHS